MPQESTSYWRARIIFGWLAHMDASLHHETSLAPARDEALLARGSRRLVPEPGAAGDRRTCNHGERG